MTAQPQEQKWKREDELMDDGDVEYVDKDGFSTFVPYELEKQIKSDARAEALKEYDEKFKRWLQSGGKVRG